MAADKHKRTGDHDEHDNRGVATHGGVTGSSCRREGSAIHVCEPEAEAIDRFLRMQGPLSLGHIDRRRTR